MHANLRRGDRVSSKFVVVKSFDDTLERLSLGYGGSDEDAGQESLAVALEFIRSTGIDVFAPAIGNAIFDATGVRIRRAPLSPGNVKSALS